MIVKNESEIIENTLNNLCSYIKFKYWVICDTGSTDNTPAIITKYFKKKKIPGELCHHTWCDFGHNRTLALQSAYNKTDYLLIFDADDSIIGNFKVPELIHDKYNLFFGNKDFKYVRPLLINNRKKWEFKGILHEYLEACENINSQTTIEGDYFIVSGREGNRNKNANKYLHDAILLEKEIDRMESSNNTDKGLLPRYTFYCAQSFKDSNDVNKAIFYYKKVLDYDTWIQEKYVSALNIGNLYERLNNIEDAMTYWYKAITYDKERRETVLKIMDYYFKKDNFFALNCLHEQIKDYKIKDVSSKLFLECSRMHDNHYLNSIGACYISEWMSGYYSCKYLILNDAHVEITLNNFKCYAYNVHLDLDNKPFLDKLLVLFDKYIDSKQTLIKELWNIISKNYKSYLPDEFTNLNNKYLFLPMNDEKICDNNLLISYDDFFDINKINNILVK